MTVQRFKGVIPFNRKYRNYIAGGYAKPSRKMSKAQLQHDSLRAMLQPGEIIIPRKYVRRVARMLHRAHINLPGVK
jgi:hypothetical protein